MHAHLDAARGAHGVARAGALPLQLSAAALRAGCALPDGGALVPFAARQVLDAALARNL